MTRLSFSEEKYIIVGGYHPDLGWGYEVYNQKAEKVCAIRKVRNGQWIHWSIVIERYHLENADYISISPVCQDEIREFCRKLNGK